MTAEQRQPEPEAVQETAPEADSDSGPGPYESAVSPFVERFAADLTQGGMQRMAARVFSCLLASEEGALTSAELAERLRVSPAAVSGAVRYLSQVHMVGREREPGSRRERYRVHADLWFEALTNRDQMLNRWITTLRWGVESVGPQSEAGRRIRETSEFFEFMLQEMSSLMGRWHKHREALHDARSDEPG